MRPEERLDKLETFVGAPWRSRDSDGKSTLLDWLREATDQEVIRSLAREEAQKAIEETATPPPVKSMTRGEAKARSFRRKIIALLNDRADELWRERDEEPDTKTKHATFLLGGWSALVGVREHIEAFF